jgi:hypothetical protein
MIEENEEVSINYPMKEYESFKRSFDEFIGTLGFLNK